MTTATAPAPTDGFGLTMAPVDQYGVRRDRMLLWQTEGYVAPDATSAEDILERAGLNWGVNLVPLTVTDPHGKTITDPKRRVIVRDDTYQPLGVAKSRYVPFSTAEVLEFTDTLFDSGQLLYEAAWSWRNGESVGVTMRVPDQVTIGGVDQYGIYVLIRTGHDGGGAVTIAATPIRLACTNMVTAALKGASRVFRAAHNSTLAGKIQEARDTLDVVFNYTSAWDLAAQELLATSITKDKVGAVAEEIFGEKHKEPVIEVWMDLANIADYRETAYGAYNALTEYAQWIRPRSPRLETAVHGTLAKHSAQAYALLAG